MKVVVNNGQFKLTLPKDLATAKNWNSTTKVYLTENAQGLLVIKQWHEEIPAKKSDIRKIVVNNGQYKLTIPKGIATARNWTSETQVLVTMDAQLDLVIMELGKKRPVKKRK